MGLMLLGFALVPTTFEAGAASIQPETRRVSISSLGAQSEGGRFGPMSSDPSISADGRFVAFWSYASNLVENDTNDAGDVFVRDRTTGVTERVSINSDGGQSDGGFAPSISADGNSVAFEASTSVGDIFVHDRTTGETTSVSISSDDVPGNNVSQRPSMSADGQVIAFDSGATTLIDGDTNGNTDVFVHNRTTGETTLVSVSTNGIQGNGFSYNASVSANGRFVAFTSSATNLVGRDTNEADDVFVHDITTGETRRVSISSTGRQGNNISDYTSVSQNGRYVAFASRATNLVGNDTNGSVLDVFVRDRQAGKTVKVSINSAGTQGNRDSYLPSISADGQRLAFISSASNLVPDDTNKQADVFVHNRASGKTKRVSVSTKGVEGNGDGYRVALSSDGRYAAFASEATNLVRNDTNDVMDVFVRGPLR